MVQRMLGAELQACLDTRILECTEPDNTALIAHWSVRSETELESTAFYGSSHKQYVDKEQNGSRVQL